MDKQLLSYPTEFFYLAALIGVILILVRPRWAFLFSVFGLAVRNYHTAVNTRSAFLGEFVNLNDLFLWIGILSAMKLAWQGQKLWVPKILLAIIAILVVGDFQSLFRYGFSYEIMQTAWWAWTFPLAMLAAANVVRDNEDARLFYWALFIGALGAAMQHLVFMKEQVMADKISFTLGGLRTIEFMASGGIFLVISAFFLDMRRLSQRSYIFIFWTMGLPFIVISYIMSFTRTIWVGAAMAFVSLVILFYRDRGKLFFRFGYSLALLAFILLAFQLTSAYVLKGVNLEESIDERTDFIRYNESFEEAYQTRENGMETELRLWQDGSIIWGVGSCYSPSLFNASVEEVGALGHVAFSTYLAHFGLIGLITYGLFLPFLTIRIGRRYLLYHKLDYGGAIVITAMAVAFFDLFTLLSSNQYISPNGHVQGLIYGAMWGLSRSLPMNSSKNSPNRLMLHRIQQWLPGSIR